MESHINYLDKEQQDAARKLRRILECNRVKRTDTLIEKAQDYTGLETGGIKTLLKKAKVVQRRKEFEKDKVKADIFNFQSVAAYRRAQDKASKILSDFWMEYSMGSLKKLYLRCPGQAPLLFCQQDMRREYARSTNYTATHGEINLELSKREFNALERIEGIWTVILDKETGRAKWLRQEGERQYYSISWKYGYCIGQSHDADRDKAKVLQQSKHAARQAAKKKDENEMEKLLHEYWDMKVSAKDFELTGACKEGIKNAARRHDLDPDGRYSIKALLELNDLQITNYTKRLVSRLA